MYRCEIPRKARIGNDVEFIHRGLGIVGSSLVTIEDNVQIQHHVTIGTKDGKIAPIIHKDVFIGPFAMILGNIDHHAWRAPQ